MAEIQITDEYNSQGGVGGTCYLCNASKRQEHRPERIITTNLEVDYDAEPGVWPVKWLEFCETCVTEMAHLLGMKTEDEVQELQYELTGMQTVRIEMEHKAKLLQKQLEAMEFIKDNPVVRPAPTSMTLENKLKK